MRRNRLYLQDMVDAAGAVESFIAGRTDEQNFMESEILRSAVPHKLTIIGEAAARVGSELRENHPEVEWAEIIGFRNIVVHEYFALDWKIDWETATKDVPALNRSITAIMGEEFSKES